MRTVRLSFQSKERGAALLIVLLIVATLSVVALSITQSMILSARVAVLSSSRSQALWFVAGAEDLAIARLSKAFKITEGRFTRNTPGLNEPIVFEIPGGQIKARVIDRSNCFNVNSLGKAEQTSQKKDEEGFTASKYFVELLLALDIDQSTATEVRDAITDWVDVDTNPKQRGAEANYYANLDVPYVPPNARMSVIEELRAIRGIDLEVYKRIEPLLCALPNDDMGVFNINTLEAHHAPLLTPLFSSEIGVEKIHLDLKNKAVAEFASVSEFVSREPYSTIAVEKRHTEMLGTTSEVFTMRGEVVYLGSVTSYEAVFSVDPAGKVKLIRRRLGVDQ